MKHISAIFFRELKGYFNSPIAYIFLIVFLLVNCGLYMTSFFLVGVAEMRSFFSLLPIILVVFMPAVSMRLWAEDKKQGTIELLLTFPMPTWQIVLGKYLAALLFFAVALLCTWPIPFILNIVGSPDMGPVLGGYIGALLIGGFYLSVGLFISGLTSDQIVAFILSTVVCFLFFMSGIPFITAQLDGWSGFFELGTKLQNYVGVTQHFETIQKGVIDIQNLIYFAGMTILFILLNAWFTDVRLKKGGNLKVCVYGVIIFFAVVFLNVVASGIEGGRFDLTENKLFTVSDAAKNVLKSLKAPVKIKFYITPSEKMPSEMKNLERDVRDKLEEFKLASKGKLRFEIFNPTGDGALAEKLQKLDIQPIQVQSVDRDEIGVKLVYSALSISYLDKKEEVIPAVHPRNIQNLEYELISRIYKISSERKPKLAVFASKEIFPPEIVQFYLKTGRPIPEPKNLYSNVEEIFRSEGYDVRAIELTKDSPVPDDIDTLVILRPKGLNDRQRYEIAKYLGKGGNLIMAIQTYEYDYNPQGRRGTQIFGKKIEPDINPLLKTYGIRVDEKILMDSNHELLMIPTNQKFLGFNAVMNVPVKVPTQIAITAENMNHDISVSNHISSLLYLWGTALDIDNDTLKKHGIDMTVLATTGKKSWQTEFRDGLLPATALSPPSGGFEANLPVAALFEGVFPDPYMGSDIPEWPAEGEKAEEKSSAEKKKEKAEEYTGAKGRMILVGSGKMFDDNLIGAARNGMFLINAVDALSLGEDIIKLRGKTQTDRLLRDVSAFTKIWTRLLAVFFMPLMIACAGTIRYLVRKREQESYLRFLKV